MPLLSFAFPAGSETVRASAIAERSSREGQGVTPSSAQARRNARTSEPPSANPIPCGAPEALQSHRQECRNVGCPLPQRHKLTASRTLAVETRHTIEAPTFL